MKSKILKSGVLVLFLVLFWAGCDKEDLSYDPSSIIGKWELLYTSGGIVGTTYSKEGILNL